MTAPDQQPAGSPEQGDSADAAGEAGADPAGGRGTRGRLVLVTGADASGLGLLGRAVGERLGTSVVVDGQVLDAMLVEPGPDQPSTAVTGVGLVRRQLLRWAAGLALAETYLIEGYDVVVADRVEGDRLEDYLDLIPCQPNYLVVVGAGIVGLGHAVAALRRGLTVALVDRASGIAGASVRNSGHLCVTGVEGEARAYAELARELWLTLAPEAGFWLRESGTVVVARAEDELAVLEEFRERRGGQDARILTTAEVRDRVPVADGVAVGGAFLPADLQVDPREAAAAIARWLDPLPMEANSGDVYAVR